MPERDHRPVVALALALCTLLVPAGGKAFGQAREPVRSNYPGAFCQHQRYVNYSSGHAYNNHSSNARTMICPVLNSDIGNSNQIRGSIEVQDLHPTQNFSCALKNQYETTYGTLVVQGSTRWSSGWSWWPKRLEFNRAPNYFSTGSQNNWRSIYYFSCVVPPKSSATSSEGFTSTLWSGIKFYFIAEQ